jgi:hypothetical protein
MGLLKGIAGAIKWIVTAPFIAIDYVLNVFANVGEDLREAVGGLIGVRKKRPPSAKIRAELRQQWLDLAPGETEIPGVEWEGEMYYETPK